MIEDKHEPNEYELIGRALVDLRDDGATEVVFCNPDADLCLLSDPAEIVSVKADWTAYLSALFDGDTILGALQSALDAKRVGG